MKRAGSLLVRLFPSNPSPESLIYAAARTCYSKKPVFPDDGHEGGRVEALLRDLLRSGHMTPFMHINLTFYIEGVSRLFVWSRLHNHPFYNSEQVSQRYVEVGGDDIFIPELPEGPMRIFMDTAFRAFGAYMRLTELLYPHMERKYHRLFPLRKGSKRWDLDIRRKAMEIARYLLPLASTTRLYHTVNLVTLLRYLEAWPAQGGRGEGTLLAKLLRDEVISLYPGLHCILPSISEGGGYEPPLKIGDEPLRGAIRDFDSFLDGRISALATAREGGGEPLSSILRGLRPRGAALPLLHPGLLNTDAIREEGISLSIPSLTFFKTLSHSADSQNQRHRMTPGFRFPLLPGSVEGVEIVAPFVIRERVELSSLFDSAVASNLEGVRRFLMEGGGMEDALYLLPSAVKVRVIETGGLSHYLHKWRMRLCLNAQEEIWRISLQEIREAGELLQRLQLGEEHYSPICVDRCKRGVTPYCPEGKRFCGIPVWKKGIMDVERVF